MSLHVPFEHQNVPQGMSSAMRDWLDKPNDRADEASFDTVALFISQTRRHFVNTKMQPFRLEALKGALESAQDHFGALDKKGVQRALNAYWHTNDMMKGD